MHGLPFDVCRSIRRSAVPDGDEGSGHPQNAHALGAKRGGRAWAELLFVIRFHGVYPCLGQLVSPAFMESLASSTVEGRLSISSPTQVASALNS